MATDKEKYYPVRSINSNNSTASLFESRKFYYEKTIPYILDKYLNGQPNAQELFTNPDGEQEQKRKKIPITDLYNENALYGIIDTEGDIIAPIQKISNFKQVGKKNKETLYLQNFVAEALADMKKYLNDQILKNCNGNSGTAFSQDALNSPFYNMEVKKAYTINTDIDKLYNSNAFVIASKFKSYIQPDKKKFNSIKDFESFIIKYIPFLKEHLFVSPVTKSRSMCFYNFKVFNNGLTFSFSEDDPGNDENKYEKYFLDIGFFSFAKACIRFGFRMDKNVPFILHADLASPAMLRYMQKYGMHDPKEVFNTRYRKLYKTDIYSTREFFINSYNSFLKNNEYYESNIIDSCSNVKTVYLNREPILEKRTLQSTNNSIQNRITQELPITFWTKIYIYFKILELKPGFSQQEYESIVRGANKYMVTGMREKGFFFINNFFNELIGVNFFDSLLPQNTMLKLEAVGQLAKKQVDLVF